MRVLHALFIVALGVSSAVAAPCQDSGQQPDNLPPPDAEPADMGQPVQVFILMGQSNMLGFGNVDALADLVKNRGRFSHLMDEAGNWTTRRDVRNVRVMFANGSMQTFNNEWLTVSGKNFGPEIGFGHIMGHVLDAPVLVLKSCIGNRALGWDLLPPGSESYEHGGKVIPGYEGSRDPSRRPKGRWYAGKQYDDDTDCVREVLAKLGKYYPGARGYEIAGFVWWQGHKDQKAEWASRYEQNLVQLIKSLREDFDAPEAPFVCATIGFGGRGMSGDALTVAEAQLAVADPRKYPEFAGNVKTVDARPFWRGGGAHYGGNPETYMEVGSGLGWAMAELIENSRPGGAVRRLVDEDELDGGLRGVFAAMVDERFGRAEEGLQPYLAGDSEADPAQIAYARKLGDHLDTLVSGAVADLQRLAASGDLCGLRDELGAHDDRFRGVSRYDAARGEWEAALGTDAAIAELKAGADYQAIVAKKERLSLSSYYGRLDSFRSEHPDSFYGRQAEQELRSIDDEVQQAIAAIDAVGAKGDVYAKFTQVEAAEDRFGRIPAFDAAEARWKEEFRDRDVRDEIRAGESYAEVFEDLADLDERYRAMVLKINQITAPRAKEQAAEKAKQNYERKLETIASRLEKLAASNPEGYYGRAAQTAYQAYVASGGATLENPLSSGK